MAASAPTTSPPGWYADPGGSPRWRYWDGAAWTDHFAPRYLSGTTWTPPPAIDASRLRPRTWWYWLSGAVPIAACAAAAVVAIGVVDALDVSIVDLHAPGIASVRLAAGDQRTIYLHSGGSDLGTIPSSRVQAARPRCAVAGPPGSGAVKVSDERGVFTLRLNSDRYAAKQWFGVPRAGAYRVTCAPGPGSGRTLPLSIGPRITSSRVIGGIAGVVALLLGGVAACTAIVVVTSVRRRSCRRRLESEAAGTSTGI